MIDPLGNGASTEVAWLLDSTTVYGTLVRPSGPPGRTVGAVARAQVAAQLAGIPTGEAVMAAYDAAIAHFIEGEPFTPDPSLPRSVQTLLQALASPANLPFARELWLADTAALLKQLQVPALIAIGKKDIQVDWQADGEPLQRDRRVACCPSMRSDSAKLLDPLVPADLSDVQAVLGVNPATVRPELELAGFESLFAPRAKLLPGRGPDLDPASAHDVEDARGVHGHVARPVHAVDLGDVLAVQVEGLPAQILPVHDVDDPVGRDVDVVRQVELAWFGGDRARHRLAAKLLDEDRIAASPGQDQLTVRRKAVHPVLSVAVRDEDVAVRRLNCAGGHVERRARRPRLARRPQHPQHLTRWRMPGDGVQAGVGNEHLVLIVHPDRVRRRELEIPVAVQRAVWVEHDDPALARQDAPDAASGRDVAHADVCPAPRITGDRRGHAFDLLLGPAFDDLELEPVCAEPSPHES